MPHLSACASSSAVSPDAKLQARIDAMIETRPATNSIFDNINFLPFCSYQFNEFNLLSKAIVALL